MIIKSSHKLFIQETEKPKQQQKVIQRLMNHEAILVNIQFENYPQQILSIIQVSIKKYAAKNSTKSKLIQNMI